MTMLEPEKLWWTAAEIADAHLTDLPRTRQAVDKLIKREGWRERATLARPREHRGGGWEYHWKNFPSRAQRQLLIALNAPAMAKQKPDRDEAWRFFEALPNKVQEKARARLLALQQVEALMRDRELGKYVAVNLIAKEAKVAARSIWNWFEMVEGVRVDDRLPFLAPRHRAAPKRKVLVHASPIFMDLIKSNYLRASRPSFTAVYRAACRMAVSMGIEIVPERTALRRYKAEVHKMTEVLAREGVDALKRYFPPQKRDKTTLRPLEVVNADNHRWDVFVEWPLEPGQDKPVIARPQMTAFQDVFSAKILSWRIDQTPNMYAVALAAGDMIEKFGIPEHVLFDNGREFAGSLITGGAENRYRWKPKSLDVKGLFVSLGCEIHWATPYSGQSKPIERAFRDLAGEVAKDVRFDGAYTGNRPDAKPEDYQSKAVPLEVFLQVIAEGIEEHNARQDRRSDVAFGRSFNDVFDEGYASSPIRKATEAQRRLWMMGAVGVKAQRKTGLIKFMGNEYWDAWMNDVAGEEVIVRFDPADFHSGLHIYSLENEYLGHALCKAKIGFLDTAEARATKKAWSNVLKTNRAAEKAHKKFRAVQLGQMMNDAAPEPTSPVEAKVVRPVFAEPRRPIAPLPAPEVVAQQEAVQAEIVDMMQRLPLETTELPLDRYRRAHDLEAAAARGEELTRDQRRWLGTYQSTAEYEAHSEQWAIFGDRMFG